MVSIPEALQNRGLLPPKLDQTLDMVFKKKLMILIPISIMQDFWISIQEKVDFYDGSGSSQRENRGAENLSRSSMIIPAGSGRASTFAVYIIFDVGCL